MMKYHGQSSRIAAVVALVVLGGSLGSARAGQPIPSVKSLADSLPCTVDFFDVDGCHAFLIRPKGKAALSPMPWVWYAPVIGHPNSSHQVCPEFFQCQELVDFVAAHAGKTMTVGWQRGNTTDLPGLRVNLSKPVLVGRSKGYLWFPTVVRLSSGDLVAMMPVWLSTAGGGVSWLHVRLDNRPKYYSYGPYRQDA